MEIKKITGATIIKDILDSFMPCPICGNNDILKIGLKFSKNGCIVSGKRVICEECGTDLTFEKGEFKEPFYPNHVPVSSRENLNC